MNISNQTEPRLNGHRSIWSISPQIPPSVTNKLGQLSPMLGHLLYIRGHTTPSSILDFILGTDINYDPFLLPNMHQVVQLIKAHLEKKSKIAIYGDLDCDGLSASAILYETFSLLGVTPTVIIPTRREGHGLADFRLEGLARAGTNLVITVDCGVTSNREVDHIHKLGMDVIVTDHHTPGFVLPNCLVINPQLVGSQYPFKYLSGSGVAYKLAQAMGVDTDLVSDLAALGTIADVVPLRDENRTLAIRGLEKMQTKSRPGLVALFKASAIDLKRIDSSSIAFYIAPKLNSANRMADPRVAYELLVTRDDTVAKELSKSLGISNKQRQLLLEEHFSHLVSTIDKEDFLRNVSTGLQPPIIITHGSWPPGISGLIASRLTDMYGVPAICASENEWGEFAASGRSIHGVNLISIIESCSHFFRKFGGHSGAAGFLCNTFDEFLLAKECLEREAKEQIGNGPSNSFLNVDAEIYLSQVNIHACEQINTLGPYGQDFPEPLFLARGIKLVDRKTMSEGKHLSALAVRDWYKVRAVFFSHDLEIEMTDEDRQFDLVFNISVNMWKGRPEVQIIIRDWRLTDPF